MTEREEVMALAKTLNEGTRDAIEAFARAAHEMETLGRAFMEGAEAIGKAMKSMDDAQAPQEPQP